MRIPQSLQEPPLRVLPLRMQGLGSGVALEGGSGRYKHITAAVRRRNALAAHIGTTLV